MIYTPVQVPSAVNDLEAYWLHSKASMMDTVVEIGSFKGKSTHALLSGCKGTVYAVDHFLGSSSARDATYRKSGKEVFLETTKGFNNLKLLEMSSEEAAEFFEEKSIDMVFIDAGHEVEEVFLDLQLWYPKVIKLLCGHDYPMNSVQSAINKFGLEVRNPVRTIWEHWREGDKR